MQNPAASAAASPCNHQEGLRFVAPEPVFFLVGRNGKLCPPRTAPVILRIRWTTMR